MKARIHKNHNHIPIQTRTEGHQTKEMRFFCLISLSLLILFNKNRLSSGLSGVTLRLTLYLDDNNVKRRHKHETRKTQTREISNFPGNINFNANERRTRKKTKTTKLNQSKKKEKEREKLLKSKIQSHFH